MMALFRILILNLLDSLVVMGLLVLSLWLIHTVDAIFFKLRISRRFGMIPRARFDPWRLFFSSAVHADYRHLAANSLPLLVLGALVMVKRPAAFGIVLIIIIVVEGFMVWIFGRPHTLHRGASGVILGFFGYNLGSIFWTPDFLSLLVAVLVMTFYLGLWRQIVTLRQGISTAGHLSGFIGGLVAAGIMGCLPPAGYFCH